MRKRYLRIVCLCLFAWFHVAARAQTAMQPQVTAPAAAPAQTPAATSTTTAAATPAMPSDPAQLLALAAKVNGLTGADLKPWHLKASYETFDEKGKSTGTGTFEEWWASETQYKRSYVSATFTQTDYATGEGLFRTGEQKWPGMIETAIRRSLLEPIPDPVTISEFNVGKEDAAFGNLKLSCISTTFPIDPKMNVGTNYFPVYCFDPDKPVLRFAHPNEGVGDVAYNSVAVFQGRYIAREITILKGGKQRLTVKLDVAEGLSKAAESQLLPPADATSIPLSSFLQLLVKGSPELVRIKDVPPNYPRDAKYNHIQGTLTVQATIGKTGQVTAVKPMSGQPLLLPAAVEAARQWVYRPILFCGQPIEAATEIHFSFAFKQD